MSDFNDAVALPHNSPLSGTISSTDEKDFYRVELTSGNTYTFTIDLNDGLFDSVLELYDSNGNALLSDDDSGVGYGSQIVFTPTISASYYLGAASYGNAYTGGYTITSAASILENRAPTLTGTETVFPALAANSTITLSEAQLLAGWTDPDGNALTVQNLHVSSGSLSDNLNGTWSFTAPATGQATLTYDVWDGQVGVTADNSIAVQASVTPTISVAYIGAGYTTEGGGTEQISVSLNAAITSGSFSVTLRSSDISEGGFATGTPGVVGATKVLTFNASNWSTPQLVSLVGQQDYENDGDMSYTVRATATNGITGPVSSYATAIRDLSTTLSLTNRGDLTATGADRDVPVYLIGDDGRPQADTLAGNDGADRLYGGYMTDDLQGGIGNDRLYGSYENDFLYGGSGDDQLYGEQDDDYLNGGAGNDRLDGGIGADTLVGGEGNDTYYVTLGDDGTIEDLIDETVDTGGAGTDTIYIPFQIESYVAPTGVEIVRMNAGFGNTSVTGNSTNNGLYGNAGDNQLDGGLGNDTLSGGSGADDLVGGDGSDSLLGGTGADWLYAGSGNDVVDGGDGNDQIVGGNGAGNDRYVGGTGTDTVIYTSANAGISVNLANGSASGTDIGSDTLSGIENVVGGKGGDSLLGDAAANTLTGDTGNDTLDGGTGADTMIGGDGSDIYVVRDSGDLVIETNASASTGGNDTVMSYLSAYMLGNNVENGRIVSAGAASLTGNALNNLLYAGAGNNVLAGGTGTDTVSYVNGPAGVTVSLASSAAQATGGSGLDTLSGIENLTGSAYADTLTGSSTSNVLTGGAGKDTLRGNGGNDTFDFNALGEMGTTSSTWDVITDFNAGDKIDLSTLDANSATAADNAFTAIIGSAASFTAAGQLKVSGGVLYGNTDADASAEFAIALTGVSSLSLSAFVL